jgi:hypothetical protein
MLNSVKSLKTRTDDKMELVPPLVYSLLGRDGIQRRADIIGRRELMRNTVSDLAAVLYIYKYIDSTY